MIMNLVTAYLKSPLGILKLACLVTIALVVALSSYSHFNSHWVYHSRMVDREEVSTFNLSGRDKLTEFRNEFEECRYNSRLYTRISLLDSPEKVNGFGARQYDSTPENACPHPVMELFLVATSVSILIVSLISLLAISIWLPVMVSERSSIKFYRILDLVLFCLATLFLFIGMVMFWYSTDNIWEWCSLKTSLVTFAFKPKSRGLNGNQNLRHDDNVDIITGDNRKPNNWDSSAENSRGPDVRRFTGNSREALVMPTAGPPTVLYLTRVKRDIPNIEVRVVNSNSNSPDSQAVFDMELQKIRQDQYMDLCIVRQMTDEKYFAVAAAVIATLLHAVTIVLICMKCGKGAVHDSHDHDREAQQQRNEDDRVNDNNKRPMSGQEPRQNLKNDQNGGNVSSDYNKSYPNYVNNDNNMVTHNPNGHNNFGGQSPYNNDEGTPQNENGQDTFSMQPHRPHHHHEGDHRHKPPGIEKASGPSATY